MVVIARHGRLMAGERPLPLPQSRRADAWCPGFSEIPWHGKRCHGGGCSVHDRLGFPRQHAVSPGPIPAPGETA